MKKLYKNLPIGQARPKKRTTKAQKLREWENLILAGGMVRRNSLPATADRANRARGSMVRVIGVPLKDNRQMWYLRTLADEGIIGCTPEEVAAWLIMEGIQKNVLCPNPIKRPKSWEGFDPMENGETGAKRSWW
jgi:hypothetical protein